MHGRVVEGLGSRIALGRIAGTVDPDRIAQGFQVSRALVREALRTLSAKGMVQARQRTGTSVTEPASWALLDEDVIRWRAAGPERFVQLHEALELRERLEPLAARRTADYGDAAAIAMLARSIEQMEQAIAADDGDLMIEADTAYHRALYLGSGNRMLARLAGTVHACLRVPDFQGYRRFSEDTLARHRHLADLVSAGDGPAAEALCAVMTEQSVALFREAHASVADPTPTPPDRRRVGGWE